MAASRDKPRGKGLEYSRASLPAATREHLEQLDTDAVLQELGISDEPNAPSAVHPQAALDSVTESSSAVAIATPAGRLPAAVNDPVAPETTAEQRQIELARTLVVGELRSIARATPCTRRRAAQLLLERARRGALRPALAAKLEQAADARGRSGAAGAAALPSLVSVLRWDRALAAGRSLAPLPSAHVDLSVRPWYRPFFALTDRPQKPTLRSAYEQLTSSWRPEWAERPDGAPPSYHAALRAWAKRSGLDRLKGRHSGSALRARTYYHQRTYADLEPWSEVHADGWTTHFTAPHPVTGQYVTYEVWHFHDCATRYVSPLAIGLTENTDTILEGLAECIRVGGVPAIWQTDHSSSVKNARVLAEHAGLADRLGITVVHPQEVGNSQANGIPENFNTWLDREARALATYQHPDRMDARTFVRVRRITNAMVRAAQQPAERAALRKQALQMGRGLVFDTHAQALEWLQSLVEKWNHHPHRSLPKVRDAAGRLVHMSPQQSLDAAIAAGWQPQRLSEEVLADEFRPHLRKSVYRGCVTPFNGQRYHHPELAHLEGQEVLVAIDREDASRVTVKDTRGRALLVASLVAAVPGRTETMREHAERRRAEARMRLREQQIEAIREEIAPPAIEAPAKTILDLPALPAREPERALKTVLDLPAQPARPPERKPLGYLETHMRLAEIERERALALERERVIEREQDMGREQAIEPDQATQREQAQTQRAAGG